MHSRPKEYLLKVSRLFGEHISGWILAVVAIVLSIASAFYMNDPTMTAKLVKASAAITGIVTVLLVFRAQYDAWRDSQEKCEAEMARNVMPDLRGTFSDVSIRQFPYADQTKSGAWIDFKIYVCNQSNAETTIREMAVTASTLSGQLYRFTSNAEFHPMSLFWKDVLSRGIGQRFVAHAGLEGIGFNMIDPATVTVSLIDGFGREHPLSRDASGVMP